MSLEKQLCRIRNKAAGTDPVDLHLGWTIYRRRISLGLSQREVAEAIGVSFQQIHKYESALARMTAARLWSIARVLELDMADVFRDLAPVAGASRWAGGQAGEAVHSRAA